MAAGGQVQWMAPPVRRRRRGGGARSGRARRHRVARIAFVNKMDRDGASYAGTALDIEKRLGAKTLLLQYPRAYPLAPRLGWRAGCMCACLTQGRAWRAVGESSEFRGMVDLISMESVRGD